MLRLRPTSRAFDLPRQGRLCPQSGREDADGAVIRQTPGTIPKSSPTTQVKGVGEWTAQMFLMFALRRPDVLPCADLGIRNAKKKLYRMRELPAPARMEKVARPWRPYASVACWYLWRSLDNPAKL